MSNIATEGREDFASGLAEDLFGDGTNPGSAHNTEKPPGSPEEQSNPSTDDSVPTEDKKEDEETPTEETPTDNPPSSDNPEETTEPKEKEQEIEAGEQSDKPLKIGKLEFATTDDALAEATRIIGHNAQLAGDVNSLTEQVTTIQAQLAEALEANEQWAKYYEETAKTGNIDPTIIARRAVEEYENSKKIEQTKDLVKKEFEEIMKSPHYAKVYPTLTKLAKQTNPITNQKYTPKEAYEFALYHHKITPEVVAESPELKPPSKVPKSMVAKPAAGNKGGGGTEARTRDEYDDALDGYMTGVR